MVAEELNLPIGAHEHSPLQDFDDDDAEETLSLSDLPLNSSASDCQYDDDSSKDDRSSSSVDEDLFEFFSQDFMASVYVQQPADSIIFCGRLIPCKGAIAAAADDGHHHDEEEENEELTSKPKSTKKRQILPLQSQSFDQSRTRNLLNQQQQRRKSYKSSKSLPVQSSGRTRNAMVDKYDQLLTRSKVSILAAPMKPRWYLLGGFPMEMELNDMKLRQCKRAQMKTFHQSHDNNRVHKMVDSSSSSRSRKKSESSWSLLRVLGCKGNEGVDAMVKSSLACLPQPQA